MATAAVSGGPRRNDVRLEDQENINLFSRLNLLSKELKAKIEGLKRSIEDSEEAGNEIMLMDDDTVPFVIGECFVRCHKKKPRKDSKIYQRLPKKNVKAMKRGYGR